MKADQASKATPAVAPAVAAAQASGTSAPPAAVAGSTGAAANPLAPAPAPAPASAADSAAAGTGVADASPIDASAGPPADSLVTSKPADLFDRMRHGFLLEDVDEPAVDSQLNWFANHPDFLERTFSRAELWLYYIVNQLEQRNMPRELALLPVIESAFEPYAYSRARASGLWQFISDTGRRFNLKQDWWYDGRRDPIEATRAALDYLQALHDEFGGDWLLAVAAYNCGELMVSRAIARNERLGLPTDFWHLKLPTETRGYVPELLAMRRLVANPARYGLEFSHIPDEPYFVQISTGGQIDLQVVATIAGVSVDELYELNPGFHRFATDPTGPFRLLVPIDAAEGLEATLGQLTPDERMRVEHYAVRRGDTVAKIAARFKTKPDVIRELNDLLPTDRPVIATELRVPSPDVQLPYKVARAAMLADAPVRLYHRHGHRPQIHVVRHGDTLYSLAQRLGTDVNTLAAMNGLGPNDALRAGQRLRVTASVGPTRSHATKASVQTSLAATDGSRRLTYVVRRGDTLYRIARLLQVTVDDLVAWNSSLSSRALHPGQVLVAFVKSRS
jgi:membrane-bound lytic murein transglycosylase D